jgi:hypothetical protein
MKRIFFGFAFLLVFTPWALGDANIFLGTDLDSSDVFNVGRDDVSLSYLRMIFGSVGTALSGASNQLAGEIFRIFNLGVLVMTGTLISYTMAMTVVNTSQDAQQAAQKVSPWVTARIVAGASMLIPQFNGYSGVQVLVMTVVVQGVGFADTAWNHALDYIKQTGGAAYVAPAASQYEDLATIAKTKAFPTVAFYNSSLCVAILKSEVIAAQGNTSQECANLSISGADFGMSMVESGTTITTNFGVIDQTKANEIKEKCQVGSTSPDLGKICGHFTVDTAAIGSANTPSVVKSTMKLALIQEAMSQYASASNVYGQYLRSLNKAAYKKDHLCIDLSAKNPRLCPIARQFVSGASAYYSIISRLRKVTGVAAEDTTWIDDAKAQGWIMAGMHYRALVGKSSEKAPTLTPAVARFKITNEPISAAGMSWVKSSDATTFYNGFFLDTTAGWFEKVVTLTKDIIDDIQSADNPGSEAMTKDVANFKKGSMAYTLNKLTWKTSQVMSKMQKGLDSPKKKAEGAFGGQKLDFAAQNMVTSMMIVMQNIFGYYPSGSSSITYEEGFKSGNACPAGEEFKPGTNYFKGKCVISGKGILGGLKLGLKGGHEDPLAQAANLGASMINAAVLYWSTTLKQLYATMIGLVMGSFAWIAGIEVISGIAQAVVPSPAVAGGINVAANLGQAAIRMLFELDKAAMELFLPLGSALMTVVFTTGVILAVYVPFMPFLLFLFGAIGWLIAVIEAMVAAPLVAMGVTHPEGHDLLGKSEQGLMLLLGIFVRPVLMIVGLFFAIVLANTALKLLNLGFLFALLQFYTSLSKSVLEIDASKVEGFVYVVSSVGIMTVYAYVVVAILEQVFSLIYQIPDRILRWIGGPQEGAGSAGQMMQQVKGKMSDTASQTGSAAGSSVKAPQMSAGSVSSGGKGGDDGGGGGQSTVGGGGDGGGDGGGTASGKQ